MKCCINVGNFIRFLSAKLLKFEIQKCGQILCAHKPYFLMPGHICWCTYNIIRMNFNLQAVVVNQRFHSLRSKCCVHLMSTTFPCYIWIQTSLYSVVALESLEWGIHGYVYQWFSLIWGVKLLHYNLCIWLCGPRLLLLVFLYRCSRYNCICKLGMSSWGELFHSIHMHWPLMGGNSGWGVGGLVAEEGTQVAVHGPRGHSQLVWLRWRLK